MKRLFLVDRLICRRSGDVLARGLLWLCVGTVLAIPLDVRTANAGPPPPPEKILATLRPEHPRVMATAETFAAIKKRIDGGGLRARIYANVKASADEILSLSVSVYEKRDGRRLLPVSRQVLDRVRALAMVNRIEDDRRYADRAWKELEAAAAFPDWNPAHFLDTAEMTHAFALGYDWLYDRWTEDQRRVLREAIISKGLREGLKQFETGASWVHGKHNWNQVCSGGLTSGALAVADVEPTLAARIVHEAVRSVPDAMEHYAPDGAGTEGVMYWDYGSRYNIVLLSSLETALGTDFGLSTIEGFGKSGYYQMYMSGANRLGFNFGDCGLSRVSEPQHFWLARKHDVPAFSWFRIASLDAGDRPGGALDLLWFDDRGRGFDRKTLPLDRHFRGAECASMRSSWEPDAIVVGIQAGDTMNLRGHRHLDLGSFMLDALGERWIIDSGTERQTYMGHIQHNPTHAFYRIRAEGHNLPVFNPGKGPDQNIKAVAKIVKFESTPQRAVAVVDLTRAYEANASRAIREFTFEDRKRLVVTDELVAKAPAELWWFLHTEAAVDLGGDGRTATLVQNGKRLMVRLAKPAEARFEVMDCRPLPSSPNPQPQADNIGRRKLALHFEDAKATLIQVSFEPQGP